MGFDKIVCDCGKLLNFVVTSGEYRVLVALQSTFSDFSYLVYLTNYARVCIYMCVCVQDTDLGGSVVYLEGIIITWAEHYSSVDVTC